jgi:hypothetical protein
VWQPIGGDIAIYGPQLSPFLIVPSFLFVAGAFAWVRWSSLRAMVAADALGMIPVGVLTVAYGVVPGLPVIVPLLVGFAAAVRASRESDPGPSRLPRQVAPLQLAALAVPIALGWWTAFGIAFGFAGSFLDYGLPSAVAGGVYFFAVLLWLDRRPGTLLGAGAILILTAIWTIVALIGLVGEGTVPASALLQSFAIRAVLLASGFLAVVLAGRELRRSGSEPRRVAVGVAIATALLLLWLPLLAPLPVLLAIWREPRTRATEAPA